MNQTEKEILNPFLELWALSQLCLLPGYPLGRVFIKMQIHSCQLKTQFHSCPITAPGPQSSARHRTLQSHTTLSCFPRVRACLQGAGMGLLSLPSTGRADGPASGHTARRHTELGPRPSKITQNLKNPPKRDFGKNLP